VCSIDKASRPYNRTGRKTGRVREKKGAVGGRKERMEGDVAVRKRINATADDRQY